MNDLFSLAGRTALVTGGSRGIGRMIAAGFLAAGRARSTSRRARPRPATPPPRELSSLGTCVSLPADVSDAQGVQALVAAYREARAALDILVNNAGAAWGEIVRHLPREGLGQGRRPEPEDAVLPDPGARRAAAQGGERRAAGQGDQHRLDRRHLGQPAGDLLVRGEQGRPDPADPAHGAAPGAGQHRRQRDRAGRLRLGHEPRRARPRRRGQGSAFRPAGSASTTTWPAPRSTWPRAPATTWSARRSSSTAA